ncbi:HpcH/HpaI aldolase family protein [Oceanibacterium hippocampi]|uniref:5-keto-4-deoxy-D-glucarate aldolase n=1 Tax=Oceanibacterium hippocampi TaxID=745714 RepID=A0A1Y5TUE2_9PROT|nr:aldolase/citrate lyase family protein [Oceanibacterium hippocampi]SLN73049.1 5-keto-4-deoxy-D-glucarate aldolase [Oceanibacterium hippocampi]
MRDNPVKQKLQRGETAFGTMVFELVSPGLPAILSAAGAEFALYDMEHSGISMEEMKRQFAYGRGLGLVPIVRPPGKQYQFVSRLLDLGAMGLMLPMVESRAEAEEIVSWTRYAPRGVRGAMFGGAHDDYAPGDVAEKMRIAEDRTIVLAMIETEKGVANVDEIMSVDGIHGAHLGQFDLSLSLGIPGQVDHPRIDAAVQSLLAACKAHGKFAACMAPTVEIARDWMRQGFNMVSYSYDIGLLANGLSDGIGQLRGKAGS